MFGWFCLLLYEWFVKESLLLVKGSFVLSMPKGEKNRLDYRRKQISEANIQRWKDGGCPSETRRRISEGMKKYYREKRYEGARVLL